MRKFRTENLEAGDKLIKFYKVLLLLVTNTHLIMYKTSLIMIRYTISESNGLYPLEERGNKKVLSSKQELFQV